MLHFYHLMPACAAVKNVTLPALMRDGRVTPTASEFSRAELEAVGLPQALNERPG